MTFLSINGFQLRYESAGAGSPVVLLHGLGSSADDWQLQVPAFAARHRVLTLDLRGHGQSHFVGPLAIEAMADDVARLLAQLSLHSTHLVGLSMGGCVALALAARRPEQARSLTLVNAFARYRPAGFAGLVRGLQRAWLLRTRPVSDVAAFVARGLFPKPEQRPLYDAAVASLSRNSKAVYWAAMRAILTFDGRAGLDAIRCPTLVVMGDRDRTVPRAAGEELARRIPGARALVLADSGHASPMDQAEAFNAAVLKFLADVGGPPTADQ